MNSPATRGSDLGEEFIITKAELDLARLYRDRYYISAFEVLQTLAKCCRPCALLQGMLPWVGCALTIPCRLCPVGECVPVGGGLRVLLAEDPLADGKERGEQVPGRDGGPGLACPAGQA